MSDTTAVETPTDFNKTMHGIITVASASRNYGRYAVNNTIMFAHGRGLGIGILCNTANHVTHTQFRPMKIYA